jgi:hypothetical protein
MLTTFLFPLDNLLVRNTSNVTLALRLKSDSCLVLPKTDPHALFPLSFILFLNVKIYFTIFHVNRRFSCVLPAILLRFEHLGTIETLQRGLLSISYFAYLLSMRIFYQCAGISTFFV